MQAMADEPRCAFNATRKTALPDSESSLTRCPRRTGRPLRRTTLSRAGPSRVVSTPEAGVSAAESRFQPEAETLSRDAVT